MATGRSSLWFVCPKPDPASRLRLFCFPYAGGSAAVFHPWPSRLPRGVEVCTLQLPGRGTRLREPAFTRISQVIPILGDVILPYLDIPFAFFGHSLGAFIGFELARHLRSQLDLHPAHLFVSGQRAPQTPDPHPPIRHLADDEFIEEVRRRYNGIPEEVLQAPELMEILLPALRADFSMNETYRYVAGDPLDCSISCFGGVDDRSRSHEELVAWQAQTLGSFELTMIPGDHFFIQTAHIPLLEALSREVGALLK